MPRTARTVFPDTPHHVVARGVNRGPIFQDGFEKRRYLTRFALVAMDLGIKVHAYCLMDNHVHWILTPPDAKSLGKLFHRVHTAWAMYYNRKHNRSGHLFQGRYHSSPMDFNHFWTAMRYVETNPQRAGYRGTPEEWEFASARARLTGKADPDIQLEMLDWQRVFGERRWRDFLKETDAEREAHLRHTIQGCRPCGERTWLVEQERRYGPFRRWRPRGRPPAAGRWLLA